MFFLSCSTADPDGQFLPNVAVEIKHFSIYGIASDGVIMDIVHLDGSSERMKLLNHDTRPFAPMEMGALDNIQRLSIIPFPSCGKILNKDEWQQHMKPWKVSPKGQHGFKDFT